MRQYHWLFLIFLLTIFQVTTAITIDHFGATEPKERNGTNTTYVFETTIVLWIKISDRPSPEYSCQVNINETDQWRPAIFLNNSTTIAVVPVGNLDAYTFYVFTLNCDGIVEKPKREYRTRIGRPSPPRDLVAEKNLTNVRFTWAPPVKPAGPDYYYHVGSFPVSFYADLPQTTLSYATTVDYQSGIYGVYVTACNKIDSNVSSCSNIASVTFPTEGTTTTSQGTTTTSRSTVRLPLRSLSIFSIFFIYLQIV